MMQDLVFKIDIKDANKTLLFFLYEQLRAKSLLSKKEMKALIEKGICKLNGSIERFASKRLKKNDFVAVSSRWHEFINKKQKLKFTVLYEDEYMLAVDKPLGFVCSNENLNRYFPKNVELVHRLDKSTTGVLLLAKSKCALNGMIDLFKRNKIEKYYIAVVDGELSAGGKIETGLTLKRRTGNEPVYMVANKGEKALTYYSVIKKGGDFSVVLCRIITGKTHQIRAHFEHLKHPVLGDYAYSKIFKHKGFVPRLMLHSLRISFIDPHTKKNIDIHSSIPQEFFEFLTQKEAVSIIDGIWNDI